MTNDGNREDLLWSDDTLSNLRNRNKAHNEWAKKIKEQAKKVKNPEDRITDKIKLGQMKETLKKLRDSQKHPK